MSIAIQTRPRNGNETRASARRRAIAPSVDVYENANEVLLVADVPGATKEGIDVHVDKGELSLHARRAPWEGPARGPEVTEYDYSRTFALPAGIDASKIDAELNAGVLTVHLPKSDAVKPRKIAIRGS